ncbi:MAG: hypothetical protein GWP91_11225 [Rhodobacterales bacterium]|nr:hypothetical protein [Rhodobacterales bacterium]
MTVREWELRQSRFAIVNIKTTGLTPGYDRICEIAVVVAEPGDALRLALDTIVDPERALAGAEVHGIKNDHARSSPTFDEVGIDLLRALQGRILVSHNLGYLRRFLWVEFNRLGIPIDIPCVDTMTLTSMLTRKTNQPLFEACEAMGFEAQLSPFAAAGALDTAKLLRALTARLTRMGLTSVGQLRGKQRHAFQQTLSFEPLPKGLCYGLDESIIRRSRQNGNAPPSNVNMALALYWEALLVALDDMVITEQERRHLLALQRELELTGDAVYMLHARMFAGSLVAMIDRNACTEEDREHLSSLRLCLSTLGWSPGDEPSPPTLDQAADTLNADRPPTP